jgi:CHASE2 domain-containing sensor protein
MEKLAILKLQGDLIHKGFHVTVEIYQNHDQSTLTPRQKICEHSGYLPPDLQLKNLLEEHWIQKYRELASPYRKIQPQEVIFVSSRDVQESASKLGEILNYWLRNESFIEINNRLLEYLKRDEKTQFLIRTDNFDIKKLPWREWRLIRDFYQSEVAFSPVNYTTRVAQNTNKIPLKILAILGHSQGIDVYKDRLFLEGLSWADVTFLVEPIRREVNDQLWNNAWDIIFFAGHSETEGEQGKIYINPTDSLTVEQLWFALRNAVSQGLKLAIFNSCDGLGLTQKLDDLKIPQMIVMRELVPDQVAQEFLKFFLKGLANNQSLSLAFREARERLQGLENDFPCASWLPVIYQHDLDIEDIILPEDSPTPIPENPPKISLNYAFIISLISTIFVIILRQLGGLEWIELKAFDRLMLLRPQQDQPDPRLLLIEVTEDDIPNDQAESISNPTLEQLLQKINQFEDKPAVIGLDIYRKKSIDYNRFPDLLQQIKNNKSLVTICKQGNEEENDITPSPNLENNQLKNRVGFNNLPIDIDGIIRRHIVHQTPWSDDISKAPCQSELSFAALIAEKYIENHNLDQSKDSSWENTPNFNLQLGKGWFPTLQDNIGGGGYQYKKAQGRFMGYQVLLNYKPLKSINNIAETLTLGEVINNNKLTAEQVKNRIILIGTTARPDEDYHRTPYTSSFDNNTPGVIIQAHIISYLLRVAIDGEPALKWWPGWVEWLWIGVWSISGSLVFWRFRSWIPVGIIIISLGGTCYFILLLGSVWVPFIPPLLALMLATISIAQGNQLHQTSTTP